MQCYLAMTSCLAGVRDQRAQSQAGVALQSFYLALYLGSLLTFSQPHILYLPVSKTIPVSQVRINCDE